MSEIGTSEVAKIAGIKPQMDDTDKQAVSLYAEGTNTGDAAIKMQSATYRNVRVALVYNNNIASVVTANDNASFQSYFGLMVTTRPHLYNNNTYDRFRNNLSLTLLASGARTATTYSSDQTNYNANAGIFIFDVTAVPGTDTVQFVVQVKDPVSGKYVTVLDGTAQSAVGTYIYAVGLGIVDGESKFDAIEGVPLPRTWRAGVIHSAATSFTYSVGAFLIN